jgi:hypothetical protein
MLGRLLAHDGRETDYRNVRDNPTLVRVVVTASLA